MFSCYKHIRTGKYTNNDVSAVKSGYKFTDNVINIWEISNTKLIYRTINRIYIKLNPYSN